MKNWKHRTCILALHACIVALCSGPLQADDHDEVEIPFPSQLETIRFLEKDLPIAIEVLEIVRQEEGEEAYEEVLERFQETYFEFKEIRRYDGRGAAELFLSRHRMETLMDKLLHDYFEVAETEEERNEIKQRIRSLVQEQLEHEKRSIQMQLKLLDRERGELAEELEELESIDEKRIDEQVEDLLN